MSKNKIHSDNAPQAIGTYSQAVSIVGGRTVYLSGQIPLIPSTMEMISDNIDDQIKQSSRILNQFAKPLVEI